MRHDGQPRGGRCVCSVVRCVTRVEEKRIMSCVAVVRAGFYGPRVVLALPVHGNVGDVH